MYIKSSFPDQAKVPESNLNAYEALWNRHGQVGCPDDLILYIEGTTRQKQLTYREFHTRVILAATALETPVSDGSVGKNGEMIGIISDTSSDCAVLIHSLLLLATPFTLFDSRWTPFEFENAFKLTKPTRLFVQDQLIPTFVPMAENLSMENICVLGEKIEGFRSFEEMLDDARSRAVTSVSPRPATRDTLACLVFSSGTTGFPKAVMISHGNIIANLDSNDGLPGSLGRNSIRSAQQHKIPVRLLSTPICAITGIHSCCFHPFIAPATCVIITDRSVEATLETIARYQVTVASLPPPFIRQLLNYPRLKDADLSSLRLVLTSGSHFSPELLAKMAVAISHKFYLGYVYGMTESFGIAILQPQLISGETDFHVVNSVGTLFPGVEARILREDGSEADVDEAGEMYVRSECVALGYWKNEKATREAFVDGWVRTGDLVRVDRNGFLFVVGRVKDAFKTPTGHLVSPFEIENALLTEPQGLVADAIVAGVMPSLRSKDEKGKVPRAWIILSNEGKKFGADAVIRELEVWSQQRLSDHKWLLGGIEIVDKIPKTTSGKPLRAVLQKRYEERVIEKTGSADASK